MKKPLALIILDGFGHNPLEYGNAIAAAHKPNLDRLFRENPHTLIGASGMDVGLPDGQMGNSEVGHTNIGAGRVVYQELTRITKSIEDGDFSKIPRSEARWTTVSKTVRHCICSGSARMAGYTAITGIFTACSRWQSDAGCIRFMCTALWTGGMCRRPAGAITSRSWKPR